MTDHLNFDDGRPLPPPAPQYAPPAPAPAPPAPVAPRQLPPPPAVPAGYSHVDPISGQWVPLLPVAPRTIPQDSETPKAPRPKMSWLPWAILGFVLFSGMMGTTIWALMPGGDEPEIAEVITASNPGEYFIENYRAGLRELYRDASKQAEAGAFKDIVPLEEFIAVGTERIKEESFVKMGKLIDTLNKDGWSNERAAEVMETISEGFEK